MAIIADIVRSFESWAPAATAESWDNVGLQVGDARATLSRALVALDLTPAVVDEAVELGAELVITHHPVIFRPLHAITADDLTGSMLLRLASANIALFAAHTNLDSARGGVSFELADRLNLHDVTFLTPNREDSGGNAVKLVTFVPESDVESVYRALSEAGAGSIGGYTECAFMTRGTGRFRVPPVGNPATGSPGARESVDEVRLEMEVQRPTLGAAISALRSSHPYEEVAFDVVGLEPPSGSSQTGMGAIGNLQDSTALGDFVRVVAKVLQAPGLRYSGADDMPVKRVAVCGGSGSGLIAQARRNGADVLVTGDVTYHRHFEPLLPDGSASLAIIDAGHYETEWPAEEAIVRRLQTAHPDVTFTRTAIRTSPIRYLTP